MPLTTGGAIKNLRYTDLLGNSISKFYNRSKPKSRYCEKLDAFLGVNTE